MSVGSGFDFFDLGVFAFFACLDLPVWTGVGAGGEAKSMAIAWLAASTTRLKQGTSGADFGGRDILMGFSWEPGSALLEIATGCCGMPSEAEGWGTDRFRESIGGRFTPGLLIGVKPLEGRNTGPLMGVNPPGGRNLRATFLRFSSSSMALSNPLIEILSRFCCAIFNLSRLA